MQPHFETQGSHEAVHLGRSLPLGGPKPALLDFHRRGPFVARTAELALLTGRWDQVRAGERRVVLIGGDAGVGKTRLVAEFARVAGADALLLLGHCEPSSLVAYQPVVEALRHSPETVEALTSAADRIRGRLAVMLGEPSPALDARAAGDSAADERFALFETVVWLLGELSAHASVVLVLEDLELVDRASSLMLHHVAGSLPPRVLLLLTFRDPPGSQHAPLGEVARPPGTTGRRRPHPAAPVQRG